MGKVEKIRKSPNKKDEKVSKTKSKRKKEKKINKKLEKQVTLVPRLRLEPRLISLSPQKNEGNQGNMMDVEKHKRLVVSLDTNEVSDYLESFNLEDALSYLQPPLVDSQDEQRKNPLNNSNMLAEKNVHETSKDVEQSNTSDEESDLENFVKKKHKKNRRLVLKGRSWSERELKDLAFGLQSEGFGELKKVAAIVKTKTENHIQEFLKPRTWVVRRNKIEDCDTEKYRGKRLNTWTTVSHVHLETWPNVRKWKRLAYEQMLLYSRTKDYSRQIIPSLCKTFYEEEPEPADPQVINVKLIYKYIFDCMHGNIPAQLPPKESSLVLDMLRELRLMPIAYDFEEERQFLREFRLATNFKPFEVKDEFKKKIKKAPDDDICTSNTVPVPEEVFLDLSRHRRLLQCFNPLVTPVWMVQKEQEYLEKHSKESNHVYVA